MYQEEEKVQVRRSQSEHAVKLAMANRWKDAVAANRAILEVFPKDTDSYNRLGKALMELERFPAAKKAYKKALELDESNHIAKKNLERITALAKSGAHIEGAQADPSLFIEEMGKSALTSLERINTESLIKLTAGDRVELKQKGDDLLVETVGGDVIGFIELKLRSRILKLLDGGSEYAAAVTSLEGDECKVIIKETLRAPDQGGPSFSTAISTKKVRAYTKDSLIKDGTKEEKASAVVSDSNDSDADDKKDKDWDDDSVAQEGIVSINDAAAAEDADDDDELEE